MEKEMFVKNETDINAPAAVTWDVLTNPQQTKKYMYGSETVSDWKPGSELLWKGEWEGKEMVFVKGHIVSITPNSLLVYTTIDPNNEQMDDVASNYLTVTYRLSEQNGKTHLTVTQGDYARVADGEKRYNDAISQGGWSAILEKVKAIAEAQ